MDSVQIMGVSPASVNEENENEQSFFEENRSDRRHLPAAAGTDTGTAVITTGLQ